MAEREPARSRVAGPTRRELEESLDRIVPDVIGPGLSILFCGINPGLYTAFVGQHFARRANRFWKVLALAGLTDRVLDPSEQLELIPLGMGITNLVERASATAAELGASELRAGAQRLADKVALHRPAVLAMLGAGAWRTAVDRHAPIGRQPEPFAGATCFVLPNPSGLQARYQLDELGQMFSELAIARDQRDGPQ